MSTAVYYDGGRDTFLERPSAKPPSKFDSIEYLDTWSCWQRKNINTCRKRTAAAAGGLNNAGTSACGSDASNPSSNATSIGAWTCGDGNNSRATEVTHAASSWKEEVSGRRNKPSTAPSSSRKHRKKFYWGPRVARQGQETEREVRSTNMGEPVTFALCVSVPLLLPLRAYVAVTGLHLNMQRMQRMQRIHTFQISGGVLYCV